MALGFGEDRRRTGLLGVGPPARQVEVLQCPPTLGVLDHHHAPSLAVAAAGREAGILERPHERLPRDRVA